MPLTAEESSALHYYESRERILTKQLLQELPNVKTIHFTTEEERKFYDGWYTTKDGHTVYFEVKVRDFEINKYNDWIMEEHKLNNLIKLSTQGLVLYINIFKTDREDEYSAILFSINGRLNEWDRNGIPVEEKYMAKQTFRGRENKCTKRVIMFRFEEGIDTKVKRFGRKIKPKCLDLLG